jgi:hypothetical protein
MTLHIEPSWIYDVRGGKATSVENWRAVFVCDAQGVNVLPGILGTGRCVVTPDQAAEIVAQQR